MSIRTIAVGAVFAAATACLAPAFAAAPDTIPGVVRQKPAIYRFTIGDALVTALSDGTMPMDLHRMMVGATPAAIDALLAAAFLVNPTQPPINCFLIEIGGHTVLIDAGRGNLFGPGNDGRLAEALAEAAIPPERITDVLITHIHPDHVGLLARDGKAFFTNAQVHVAKADMDLYLDTRAAMGPMAGRVAAMFRIYADSGKLRPITRDGEVVPGIAAELRPGHSPGSAVFNVESRGQRLVVIGDIIHVAQVQLTRPDVTFRLDHDPAMARADRVDALRRFATHRMLIASPHINFPGVGHVVRAGKGYRWVPIEYGNRDPSLPVPNF